MAVSKKQYERTYPVQGDNGRPEGFDVVVTSVVGRVEFDQDGDENPVVAAMGVIGRHLCETITMEGATGQYIFDCGGQEFIINAKVGSMPRPKPLDADEFGLPR
jgi:hypothetical protein